MKGIPVRPNGDPVRRTFVIADNYQQFGNWCRYSRVNPRSRMIRFLDSANRLHGVSDCDFVFTGPCRERPDMETRQMIHVIRNSNPHYRGETFSHYESADIEPNVVCAAE